MKKLKIKAYNQKEYRKIIRLLEHHKIHFKTLSKWTDEVHIIEADTDSIEGYDFPHENSGR